MQLPHRKLCPRRVVLIWSRQTGMPSYPAGGRGLVTLTLEAVALPVAPPNPRQWLVRRGLHGFTNFNRTFNLTITFVVVSIEGWNGSNSLKPNKTK